MAHTAANLRRLEATAASQHQVFTREQAVEAGFTRAMQHWRRSEGHWVVLLPGVYRFASAVPTFRMRCTAASLWSAPDGMISHLTGGALWGLEGVHRSAEIELLLPACRRLTHDCVVVHRS